MQSPSSKPDRALIGILAFVAVLVVVAVVVIFTRGAPEPLEAGTPERAVQEYTAAVIDGDFEAASQLLSPTWKDDCESLGYDATATDVRVTLVDSQVHGNTATVTVLVATGLNSGPFGGSGYEYEEAFRLDQVGGDWLIASAPWELAICPAMDLS